MAETKRIKRKKKQKLNIPALLRVVGVAVLVVLLILAAAYVIGGKTNGTVNDIGINDSGFEIGAASISSIHPYSSGIAAVADSAVYYFDGSGNMLSKNEHTYSSPVAETSGKNLILYDLGGYKFRIEKRGGIYNEQTVNSVLTCAAIGKRGNYAYSLNADGGYQSHMFVYSERGKKTFEWGSSSDYISCLTLSDNGRMCAAGILTSENAKVISVVKLFDFSADEPVISVDFSGSVVYDIAFASSKQLIVFCNDGVFSVDSEGTKTEIIEYSSNEIKHYFDCPSGLKAVSVAVYGNEKNTKVYVLSKKGKLLFEKTYTEEITGVASSRNRITVILHDSLETYDTKGNSVGSAKSNEVCSSAVISRGKIYILGTNGLYSVSLSSHANTKTEETNSANNIVTSDVSSDSDLSEDISKHSDNITSDITKPQNGNSDEKSTTEQSLEVG